MSVTTPTNNQPLLTEIRLGIVCPMANEGATAEQFITEVLQICRKYRFQSISFYTIFDRACVDGTMKLLTNMVDRPQELKIIYAPENRSVVDAYLRGYHEALAEKNDWILEIDAGYSHQPSDIHLLFNTMQQGHDCVFGSRFMKGSKYRYNSIYRYFVSKGGTLLINFLIGTRLKDMTSGFELFTSEALSSILNQGICSQGPFFQTEIKTYAHHLSIAEVPIQYKDGSHNIGKDTLIDSFSCLWKLFRKRLALKKIAPHSQRIP